MTETEEQARLLGMSAEREAKLLAEMESLRKDAERYRWLRTRAVQNTAWDIYGDGGNWTIGVHSPNSRLPFDAAIDAAMKGQQ